ncbi:putative Cid1 family poly A polymerase [Trypanosoma vivax]|nr:RNA editing 3' terminal uridylyl transferase 1 [Trypanosoma vivax]KAH8611452.1 putative Cid1 family poly A polymerase [Trypanosoma vivax]
MGSKYRRLLRRNTDDEENEDELLNFMEDDPHSSVGHTGTRESQTTSHRGQEKDHVQDVIHCKGARGLKADGRHNRAIDKPSLTSSTSVDEEGRLVTDSEEDDVDDFVGETALHSFMTDGCEENTPSERARALGKDGRRGRWSSACAEDELSEKGDVSTDGPCGDGTAEGKPHSSARLYSCDACSNAIFTTHAALLAHVEERHADITPDYTRLRRVAEKLSTVWTRALNARRDTITLWGTKIFSVAAQRDAGEAKMKEAHRARAQLECVVRRWNDKARVFIFGSSVAMGVWDGMADIDFAVVDVDAMEANAWPPLEKNAVRSITELLRRAGFSFVNLEPISHARVPIIKHHASSPILTVARREAEDVVSRSVRFVLDAPATREDRVLLEGSVRDSVGAAGVQQVWWNRTGEMMSVTLDSTTAAMRAATCSPALISPSLRAKVQPVHDECRPELYNIDFDLSFRAFGIRNSILLQKYLLSHPCARPGAIVLKDWSKTSGVNNSVNGYFTSYAINIMWIYYLVQKGYVPYVDPLEIPESLVNYTEFDPKYTPMVDPKLTSARLEELYKEAGDMLVGFFYFYSFEFDWGNHVVSLNRPGITTKKALGWHIEDVGSIVPLGIGTGGGMSGSSGSSKRHPIRYELCIEDPYEENLNLGRHIGITKSLRVKTELYRGLLSLLKEGEVGSCVFTSMDSVKSPEVADRQSFALPVRALFKLMALTTQAISDSKSFPGSKSREGCDGSVGGTVDAVDSNAPTKQEAVNDTCSSSGAGLSAQPCTPFESFGVDEKKLEGIFMEKASIEFQLARKAWNWQQLIHRLGYKIHRGRVLPRREVGVRCMTRRESEEQPMDTAMNRCGVDPMVGNKGGRLVTQTRAMADDMLRDLSHGYMTLTPEWVAWSAPWASQHLRGYSRLMAMACNSVSTTSSTFSSPASSGPGMESPGLVRGTRRNAAPVTPATLVSTWARYGFARITSLRYFR